VARFYSNENIALQLVMELRRLGHDVLTSLDAGNANSAVPDSEVLAFATAEGPSLLLAAVEEFAAQKEAADRNDNDDGDPCGAPAK